VEEVPTYSKGKLKEDICVTMTKHMTVRRFMSKFRNKSNTLLTRSLILDHCIQSQEEAIYTLKPFPVTNPTTGKECLSLYNAYLELEDVTEFEFANKYFESYEHFEKMMTAKFFNEFIETCRKHLELKLKARALRNIQMIAEDDESKEHLQANKYLIDKGFASGTTTSEAKGKPKAKTTAKEVKEAAELELTNKQDQEDLLRLKEDYERILIN